MSKPVADIMRDEAGNPEVMQHALSFDYTPVIKPDYNQRGMADGGLLPYGVTPTDEEEKDDADLTELERLTTRVQELEDAQKPNINQPVGDEGIGPQGDEGLGAQDANQGAGTGTVSSTIAGFQNLFSSIPLSFTQIALGTISHATAKAANIKAAEESVTSTETTGLSTPSDAIGGNVDATGQSGQGDDTGPDTGDTGDIDGDVDGGAASGGQIKGYQEGAMVEEQADTTMDTAGLGPMGLVDDMDGDQVTGVEDDLDMETEEGAYVLNADAVELVGLKDLNQLVKDAIDIAIESDIPLPKTVDPTKKVPIKISNGEFVIPAILVPIIGLENLEKMNKRGLEYREKNREEAPPQEAQEQDVPVEPSEVPSRGVPGEINLAQGGMLADQMDRLM